VYIVGRLAERLSEKSKSFKETTTTKNLGGFVLNHENKEPALKN
jgi:hypothetical protein